MPRLELPAGAAARITLRARDVALSVGRPTGLSIQNVLPGRVLEIADTDGVHVDVRIGVGNGALLARITRHAAHELRLAPGLAVYALVKSVALERPR